MNTDRLYTQTKEMSDRALKQAEDAYRDSLDILTEADLVDLPTVDVNAQRSEAQDIKDEVGKNYV